MTADETLIKHNIEAFIASKLAQPITHRVDTIYSDGTIKGHQVRSEGAAQTHIDFVVKPKLNRDLLDRATGRTVRVVGHRVVKL